MARPLRVEYQHAFYHVIARGHSRGKIFRSARDYERFLEKLSLAAKRHHLLIHAYALMDNHYHLLIETPEANLTRAMHDINAGYANWYRTKYRLCGAIFAGRFKAIAVEKDSHLILLSVYIHLNPVRAGMVDNPKEYAWSSYCSYIGEKDPPSFLYMTDILAKFKKKIDYRIHVEQIVKEEKKIEVGDVYGANSVLGSMGFIRRILKGLPEKSKKDTSLKDIKELKRISADDVLESIMRVFRVSEEAVIRKRRGNVYRKLYIFLLRQNTGMSLREIGDSLGMKDRTVSESVSSFSREVFKRNELRQMLEMMKKALRERSLLV